jgi:hypothetical protein
MDVRLFPCVLIVFSVLLVGCGKTQGQPQTTSNTTEPPPVQEGTFYHNTRFGYQFVVPDDTPVYALNLENQTARLAGSEDEIVFVAGEGTNVLTVRALQGAGSAHEWLTSHLTFFYPRGEAAQRIETLGGEQAISLYGDGTSESPARLMVTQTGDTLIVITFEQEDDVFNAILAAFTFSL